LCWHINPDVPAAVTGDPGRLRQIIVNLTENVIRSTREGGVAIRLETEEVEDALATLHFKVLAFGAEDFTYLKVPCETSWNGLCRPYRAHSGAF
jgi:signal transduction histidine kinase